LAGWICHTQSETIADSRWRMTVISWPFSTSSMIWITTERERDVVNEVKGEMELNGSVIKSMEDELMLKAPTDYNIESTDYQASTDQMDSIKQGKLNTYKNSEASSVACDVGEFTYYDDVSADLDLFVGHITSDEYAINHQQ